VVAAPDEEQLAEPALAAVAVQPADVPAEEPDAVPAQLADVPAAEPDAVSAQLAVSPPERVPAESEAQPAARAAKSALPVERSPGEVHSAASERARYSDVPHWQQELVPLHPDSQAGARRLHRDGPARPLQERG
jgi:hypothetical protein